MRSRAWLVLGALSVISPLSLAGDEPCMGTFKTDAVALIVRNDEVEGQEAFAVTHGNFRYLFESDASRDVFKADPARYEIQLGGACARMGALSGCADADRYAVHDGKIYIFASDGCRAGFLKDPASCLEPVSDPAPTGTVEQLARGKELFDKCLAWVGGAASIDAVTTFEYREESRVENQGKKHLSIETTTLRLPDAIRTDYRWDQSSWIKTLTPTDCFFLESEGTRSMSPKQRAIFSRQMARQIPVIFRARARPDFIACHLGPARDGKGELVAIHFDSTTTDLIIDPESGSLLGTRYLDWGPKGRLGLVERRFVAFADLNGLKIPNTWQAWFDDVRADPLDEALINCTVNPDLPEDFFTRDGRPVSAITSPE